MVPEVDVILAGHDHHYDVKPVGPHGTYVLKSGTDFRDITVLNLEFTDTDALLQLRYAEESLTSETCQEVLSAATKAMLIYKELGDQQSAADALKAVIAAISEKALANAQREMENYRKCGDRCGEATMKLAQAAVYLDKNRLQEALRWAMEAQEEFKASQLPEKEVSAHLVVAKALLAKCDTQEALQTSQRALELAEEVGDMRGEALSLQCLAKDAWSTGRFPSEIKEAIDAARKSLTIFRQSSDYKQQVASMLTVASIHLTEIEPDATFHFFPYMLLKKANVENDEQKEALGHVKEARERYHAIKDLRGEAEALRVKAKAENSMCKRAEALASLREAVELAKRVEDRVAEATYLLETARIELDLMRFEDQATFCMRALFYDAGDKKGEAKCLREAARMFFLAGYEQDADARGQEALALFQEIEDQAGEAQTMLLLAEVHAGFGDVRRGAQTAEEALQLFKSIEELLHPKDPKGQYDAFSILARVQMLEEGGDAEAAATAAEKAYQLVKRSRKGPQLISILLLFIFMSSSLPFSPFCRFRLHCSLAGWATRRIEVNALKLLAEAGVAKLVALAGGEDVEDKSEEEQEFLQNIFEKAHRAAEMAVDRAADLDDRRLEAGALRTLANASLVCSNSETAEEAAREGLKIAQEVGDKPLEASMLCISAEVNMAENYMGKASEQAKQALAIFRDVRDAEGEEWNLSKNIVGDDIEMDSPLMEAGMDSLSSVEFRNQVRNLVPGINLPASMVFDYPSLKSMTDFIHTKTSEM
eukprot:g17783.t1